MPFGLLSCTKYICATEGFWALWRGNFANCLRYAPKTAFDLAFKEELKIFFKTLIEPNGNFGLIFLAKFLSGIVATGSSTIICYPLDFARTRLAVDLGNEEKEYKGLLDVFRKNVRRHGFLGLYSGLLGE